MTLEDQCRLSYYRRIAEISTHNNVFLVQHVGTGRIYVMKEQEVYCRDVYEYLKNCQNPHVPKIYECIEDDGKLIVVEEYIQGESLEQHLEEKGVYTLEEVCHFMLTVCDVLDHLHNLPQPVIHRDLKPENILVQENGYLKIIDFNTAKKYEVGKCTDTVVIGTRKYAAPEQFGFCQSDARTDIYAMGVMMNYLLTRQYPDEFLYQSEKSGNLTITDIICKCTEFAPDHRYQTALELKKNLQMILFESAGQNVIENSLVQTTNISKKGFWNQQFLPVGFRTGRIWKMLLGIFGYYMLFSMGMALNTWADQIAFISWGIFAIAFYGNYRNIQKKFPMMEHRYLRWLGFLLWPIVCLFVFVLVFCVILT